MAIVFRRKRHGKARVDFEAYPTKPAKRHRELMMRGLKGANPVIGAASEVETHAIWCQQCGFPLIDTRNLDTCPHCGTDNFYGAKLHRER